MPASLPGARRARMKPAPQFLPPRQEVIYEHTNRMIRETGTNRRSFAMELADRYLQLTPEDDRDVPFRITRGGDSDADKKHNGQILGRFLDGHVKTMPANLEDVWVMSLPEPYRSDCERDLGARRGILPVRLAHLQPAADTAGIGVLMTEFGELVTALTKATADGVIDARDRPYAQEIIQKSQDVIIGALTVQQRFVHLLVGEGDE
ncbi:hypothetical protein [[Pseudomonas] boreopolis]|uniref:Uncharacterized protein n=1 Tax=Xanthomonas boreopolis TaxID=86183 RepID=A0A919F7D7_9XANT|nr:hypothetical protein GCM10009090_16320 [[Pseudomonas] boreopolis]